MPAVGFLGNICTGHDCYPPRRSIEASPNVFINGKAMIRVGDAWEVHDCIDGEGSHGGHLATGSSTVFVNGKPVGRIGDMVDCGSAVAEGSPNMFIGG